MHAHDIALAGPSNVGNRMVDTERPISLVYRSCPNVPESARLTLLIIAHWTNSPEAWELAVQAIRPLVLEYLPTRQEVDVEMIDEDQFGSLSLSPAGDDPEFTRNWDRICAQFVNILESNPFSRGTTTTITVVRSGRSDPVTVVRAGRTNSSDDPVTVHVSVSDDSTEDGESWDEALVLFD
jgi:hypothetical protein